MLTLAEFIGENLEAILVEWESFARTILPATTHASPEQLRDHAREMLVAMARDIETSQTEDERLEKSQGRRSRSAASRDSPAEMHTLDRLVEGFTLREVISEYRALRASVIRLWTRTIGHAGPDHLEELTRFNEAIDEAISQSIARYTERMERSRDLLLGALGHDLRNPLGAVLQSAQFLLRSDALESAHTKAASRIVNSGTRMKTMISDLLDFATTRLGDVLPVSPASVDLAEACHATAEEITALHPDRTVRVECPEGLSGKWDPGRIAQMLSNLVGNAIEHGAPDGEVLIRATDADDQVKIEVQNEGAPIPPNRRSQLFEPFTRGATQSRAVAIADRSVGLGLYIASEIAKAHGGEITLARSDEAGTVFAVTLPR